MLPSTRGDLWIVCMSCEKKSPKDMRCFLPLPAKNTWEIILRKEHAVHMGALCLLLSNWQDACSGSPLHIRASLQLLHPKIQEWPRDSHLITLAWNWLTSHDLSSQELASYCFPCFLPKTTWNPKKEMRLHLKIFTKTSELANIGLSLLLLQ